MVVKINARKVTRLTQETSGLTKVEWKILKKLKTPEKIQDFINALPFNLEKDGETHHSVRHTLLNGRAHCFEGALLAATALWIQGQKPLILDLVAIRPDYDHVVTLFRRNGHWGAISKTNHAILRYRDPIFKSVRELVMSYFNEYFIDDGRKTLRRFSKPFDLSNEGLYWITTEENLAPLAHKLDKSKHFDILTKDQVKGLRKAEQIEILAGLITEYK